MAKIYFSIEAESLEEYKAIIAGLNPSSIPSCSAPCVDRVEPEVVEDVVEVTPEPAPIVTPVVFVPQVQVVESLDEQVGDSEETKKRKRRTKAQIEADRLAANPDERIVAREEIVLPVVEPVIQAPVAEVLVPVAVQQPPVQTFNAPLPNFGAIGVQPIINIQPTMSVAPTPPAPMAGGLPSDLLSALGGLGS